MADLMRSAGETVTLKLGKKQFTLSPITIGDLAAFERHVKEDRLQGFVDLATNIGMSKDDRLEGITRILTAPFTADDFAASLSTVDGVRFLLWSSIRKKHPKFTIDRIDELGDLEELMTVVNSISNLGRMSESPPAPNQASE